MTRQIQLLDVVALLDDRQDLGLVRGQVGTVVEIYEPTVFEVEFNDVQGCPYALEAISAEELMLLHHALVPEESAQSHEENLDESGSEKNVMSQEENDSGTDGFFNLIRRIRRRPS